jgi:hypothetical protein
MNLNLFGTRILMDEVHKSCGQCWRALDLLDKLEMFERVDGVTQTQESDWGQFSTATNNSYFTIANRRFLIL